MLLKPLLVIAALQVIAIWPSLSVADEEDPLRHASAAVIRNKTLEALLIRVQQQKPPESHGIGPRACQHTQMEDLEVPLDKVKSFKESVDASLRLANLLNALYLSDPPQETSLENLNGNFYTRRVTLYPPQVIEVLVKDILETHTKIVSFGVAFVKGKYNRSSSQQGFYHYFGVLGWRNQSGSVVLGNLADVYNNTYDDDQQPGTRWFTKFMYRLVHSMQFEVQFVNIN